MMRNNTKPPMQFLPIWVIASTEQKIRGNCEALSVLTALGEWQLGRCTALDVLVEFDNDAWDDAARVLDFGAPRRGAFTWTRGQSWSLVMASAVRHLMAILRDEEVDPESGLPHRGHALSRIAMLAEYERSFPKGDDRPQFLEGCV